MERFNQKIHLINISSLYDIQKEIIIAVTVLDLKIHLIDETHVCVEDTHGFLENRMPVYKCIIIPSTLREEAFTFCNIIENVTGHEINLFCPLCGHQNI